MLTKSFFNRSPFVGNQFVPLPLGAIRASGSMQEKLITLRAGLLSHVPSLVPEAGKDSAFFGGNLAGGLYAPRYLEALLLTSALLSDQELQQSALALVDLAVASQREDGAFGAKDESIEACAAMLRTVMTAYSLTGQKAYLTFVLRYFKYLSVFLKEHPLSDEDAVHTADVLAAGITLYNITGQRAILPVLDLLIQQGADFTSLFHAFPYKIPISRQIQSESESDEEDSFIAKTKQMSDGAVLCEGLSDGTQRDHYRKRETDQCSGTGPCQHEPSPRRSEWWNYRGSSSCRNRSGTRDDGHVLRGAVCLH